MRLRNILIAREVLSAGARRGRGRRGRARLHGTRLLVVWCWFVMASALFAGETPDSQNSPVTSPGAIEAGHGPRFDVQAYVVEGVSLPSTNNLSAMFSRYTGTNVGLEEMVQAASDLQSECLNQGLPAMSVAIAPKQIVNGIVTMHLFQGASSVILVSGKRYLSSGNRSGVHPNPAGEAGAPASVPPAATNAVPSAATVSSAGTNTATTSTETNTPAAATNAVPHLEVQGYEVTGNRLLDDDVLQSVLSKYTGTNITFDQVGEAVKELTLEYWDRGYGTVNVITPVQTISNGIIKLQVFEGRLAAIQVSGNHYFSSNNVMRALPGLETNMILNNKILQPQLDLANVNQDRTIYPEIVPGPDPDTTTLKLVVHDRLPLHGKLEVNNQSTPGTPDLRVNGSVVYNNLWQENHSMGVQYSFSPSDSKLGSEWPFYDRPQVANYSGFYRLPLGNPESVADTVENSDGAFGYDEGTRKFNLPPPTGAPELNFYASRSTIDTKIEYGPLDTLLQTTARTVTSQDQQEDLTVNEDVGFRWSRSLREFDGIRSVLSAGVDFKRYDLESGKTNFITFTEIFFNGVTPVPHVGILLQPDPSVWQTVRYLPVTLRWDASRQDADGTFIYGFGYSLNFSDALFPNSRVDFQNAAGSPHADGYYHILTSSLAREQILPHDWRLVTRADGQWANQPLISNEQFGVGGVNGVRGYREGEVFGDTGWRVTTELRTPPHTVGFVGAGTGNPLVVRASAFMDYAQTYLIDPNGNPGRVPLWGTGFGGAASIGTSWQGRLAFTWPLLDAGTASAGQLRIIFGLTGQF
jgi:hemolysin activation/secretion protein